MKNIHAYKAVVCIHIATTNNVSHLSIFSKGRGFVKVRRLEVLTHFVYRFLALK